MDTIRELLSDENQQLFHYRRVLWHYLKDNHGYIGSYPNFCNYLNAVPEFKAYFNKRRPSKSQAFIRAEENLEERARENIRALGETYE